MFRRTALRCGALALALAGATGVSAETTTTCDNMCGDSQKCLYTCCHITTTPAGGVGGGLITNVSCSSSSCCAHPTNSLIGGSIKVPEDQVGGVVGEVRWHFTEAVGLDASAVSVSTDDKAHKLTLAGTVKSADQRRVAGEIAKKHAKGYKVVNEVKVDSAAQ
jgi:hypothetical protein